MLKVAKFGGSSMADAKQFEKVRDIVRADPARKVIVVSAAGKRSDGRTQRGKPALIDLAAVEHFVNLVER